MFRYNNLLYNKFIYIITAIILYYALDVKLAGISVKKGASQ